MGIAAFPIPAARTALFCAWAAAASLAPASTTDTVAAASAMSAPVVAASVIAPPPIPTAADRATSAMLSALAARAAGDDLVRLKVRYAGPYRVTGEELAAAGVPLAGLDPRRIGLVRDGVGLPLRMVTGNPLAFTAADRIEFLAEGPRGPDGVNRMQNRDAVYFLTLGTTGPATARPPRYREVEAVPAAGSAVPRLRQTVHREFDFNARQIVPGMKSDTDGFFMNYYRTGSPEELTGTPLPLPAIDPTSTEPVAIRALLHGLSNDPATIPSHKVTVTAGRRGAETALGTVAWDGLKPFTFQCTAPASMLATGSAPPCLGLRTPDERTTAVDLIGLDWIEATYTRRLDAGGEDHADLCGTLEDTAAGTTVPVAGVTEGTVVFSSSPGGGHVVFSGGGLVASDGPTSAVAVSPRGSMAVDSIAYRPAAATGGLADADGTATVLVLHPPALARSARLYSDLRRAKGYRVTTADTGDVFDTLTHGWTDGPALRDYVRAVKAIRPSLKHLVLLGDATNDWREATNRESYPVPSTHIPTHWIESPGVQWTGGYIDDNWFGAPAVSHVPDLAVGRIPANDDAQCADYLRKVVEYEELGLGARDGALVVSSVERSFQELVTETQNRHKDRFTSFTTLFPMAAEATSEVASLRRGFDDGVQLMYYVGHGGGFVWRVGPTDYKLQKDLFTPAEVRRLTNRGHYPVVTCSSCYTTSFDIEGSLGESLVMQPGAGSVAVIGTPWKSTVYEDHSFNSKLIDAYCDPAVATLGEAFLSAKKATAPAGEAMAPSQAFILLGDPCLKLVRKP